MRLFDQGLKGQMSKYIIQSLIATATLAVVLTYMNLFTDTTFVASIGATTFIVFTIPHKEASRSKYVLGGYFIGTLVGIFCNFLILSFEAISAGIFAAFAVGLAMFLMVVLDFEHPPSAAHALGVAVGGILLDEVIFLYIICFAILIIRKLFLKWFIDLI